MRQKSTHAHIRGQNAKLLAGLARREGQQHSVGPVGKRLDRDRANNISSACGSVLSVTRIEGGPVSFRKDRSASLEPSRISGPT